MKKTTAIIAAVLSISAVAFAAHKPDAISPLKVGNLHFFVGAPIAPRRDVERRQDLIKSQHPSAVVVSCSDSRVPPELVFDQGLGDLFVIRTAGEVVGDLELGSIEYAVEHLGVPLIMVMGHSQCGAVTAAIKGGELPPHIAAIVQQISPAVEKARKKKGDLLQNAVEENVRRVMAQLTTASPIVAEAVREHHVQIVGGVYDLATGQVKFLK